MNLLCNFPFFVSNLIYQQSMTDIIQINQNKQKMGEMAVDLLMDKILQRKSNVNNIKIPVNLIRRKSTEI